MNRFRFYKDEKITIWERTYFDIEANSEEEAEKIAKSFGKHKDIDEIGIFKNSELLFCTEDTLSVANNGGLPTIEICNDRTGDKLWDNTELYVGMKCKWIDPGINDYDEEDREYMLNREFEIVSIEGEVISIECEDAFAEVYAHELEPIG